MSVATLLVVPAWTDQSGQCRIVACDGRIADALQHYRQLPDRWREVGLMNSRGTLVCAEPEYRSALAECDLAGGVVIRVEA